MKISLGLLEVKGLATAIITADAMAKCAAVTIVGVEPAKGSGWQTIKVTGDVAAVNASVSAGAAMANKFGGLVSQKVIARPDEKLLKVFLPEPTPEDQPEPSETVVESVPEETVVEAEQEDTDAEKEMPSSETDSSSEMVAEPEPGEENTESEPDSVETEEEPEAEAEPEMAESPLKPKTEATCNLCFDPACPRKKGEPRINCINGGKQK